MKTKTPKVTFPVRLDPALRVQVDELAERLDVEASNIVRWAIKHYLAEYRAGKITILPFADGSHAEQIETGPTSAEATAPVPPNPAILTPSAKPAKRKAKS